MRGCYAGGLVVMNLSRNAIILLFALATPACVAPKPGDDLGKPDAASPAGDAAANRDATTPAPDGGTEQPDAEVGGDAGPEEDAAINPDAEVIEDGGDPSCVPSGPELCDNGIDDDCENGLDCNDPTCGRCLAFENTFKAGVVVNLDEPCPPGFTEGEDPLYAGLDPGLGCAASCGCTPQEPACIPDIYVYDTATACNGDVGLTGGVPISGPTPTGAMCTMSPLYDGFPGGFRLASWSIQESCTPSGTAAPTPATWTDEKKLCLGVVGSNGCESNAICYPNAISDGACVIHEGMPECPAAFPALYTDWYTGYEDTRSCGSCECTASGGSCDGAQVLLGSDWLCTNEDSLSLTSPRACSPSYSPPGLIGGMTTASTCENWALQDGELNAIGYHTVCCE